MGRSWLQYLRYCALQSPSVPIFKDDKEVWWSPEEPEDQSVERSWLNLT